MTPFVGIGIFTGRISSRIRARQPAREAGRSKSGFGIDQRAEDFVGRLQEPGTGVGLMLALELFHDDGAPATDIAVGVTKRLLHDGFILLPEGDPANILSFTPPLTVGKSHITKLIRALGQALEEAYA